MFKKYLLILIAASALVTTSGCSLFRSDSDTEQGETVVDGEEVDVESSVEGEELVASDEEEVVDEYPDDDYGDEDSTQVADSTETYETETIDSTVTDTSSEDAGLPDQPLQESTEESLYVAGDGADTSTSTTTETSYTYDSSETVLDSAASFIPVKKMKTTPYYVGSSLINRLYVVRDGDDMSKISEKIYGDSSRSSDLYKWNSHFKGKSLSVGDKVYYSSALNPMDDSKMMVFYEERGMQPSYYTAKSGESIRKVSQNLLGHPRSWMEIWATNDIESKWTMPESTQLRYWPEGEAVPAAPAMQQQANIQEPPADMGGEQELADNSMDASADMGAADMGAAPTDGMGEQNMAATDESLDDMFQEDGAAAAGTMAQDTPPPPPDITAPPPPAAIAPPQPPMAGGQDDLASMMGSQDDTIMMALGGLIILAGAILFVFFRRSRKKVKYS